MASIIFRTKSDFNTRTKRISNINIEYQELFYKIIILLIRSFRLQLIYVYTHKSKVQIHI